MLNFGDSFVLVKLTVYSTVVQIMLTYFFWGGRKKKAFWAFGQLCSFFAEKEFNRFHLSKH